MIKLKQQLFKTLLLFFFLITCYLNTFQTQGTLGFQDKFSQFDELIAIGNVNTMLTPESAKHFIFYSISGNTVMYGRALFYVDALVSYIPYKIWGLTGQIIVTRITHSAVLMFAFYLLIVVFIDKKYWQLRAAIALLLCIMPYTLYFCIVPKPEPFLILFLALFFYYIQKYNFQKFGPFIFLGLAFGTKISVLALLPVFGIYFWLKNEQNWIKKILLTGVYFFIGLIVCVPTLLLGVVKRIYWQSYISHTFGTIKQDYDDIKITVFTWLKYIGTEYFGLYWFLLIPLLLSVITFVIYKSIKSKSITFQQLVFFSGVFVILLVSITTKRIWPHYLYFGWVFFIIGCCISLEKKWWVDTLIIACLLLAFFEVKPIAGHIEYFLKREKTETYIAAKSNAEKAYNYLLTKPNVSPIFTDISAYLPNHLFVKHFRYQPFESDKKPTDIRIDQINNYSEQLYENANAIIFYKNNPLTKVLDTNYIIMKDEAEAKATFNQFVPSVFVKDTAFEQVEIYSRRK